jgi:hypothetical protein
MLRNKKNLLFIKKLYVVRNVEKADFIYSTFITGIQKKKITQYQIIVAHL